MMRILLTITLLLVCAGSVAQTTLITEGAIRMGIEVFDYENDQQLDISKLCSGFDIDGVPENLVIPNQTQIRIFFPEITERNAKDYVAYSDGQRKLSLDRYAINYKFNGRLVSNPVNESSSAGSDHSFGLVYNPDVVSPSNFLKNVEIKWKVDYPPIDLMAFIQNDEVNERQQYMDSVLVNLFNQDGFTKSYDYWIDIGYAQNFDEYGLPENPIIPIDAGELTFASNAPMVTLHRNGERITWDRHESRIDGYDNYFIRPTRSGTYLIRMNNSSKVYGQTSRTYAFTVPYSFWKEGGQWLVLIIVVLVIGFGVYRFYASRQLKQSHLLKQLSEAELKAIRSQLNPHFLFNALSAIQNLVNQEKNDLANDYIVKLSKLLRRVLVQSDESLHSLQEELELAELYLELEKLRMPFDYHIKVDESLDNNVLVPSMILQPYLENAVFHGVSKFKADQISLTIGRIGEQLVCQLKDNAQHEGNFFTEGKGMSMGRERIDILKKQLGDKINAEIRTSKGSNGFEVEIRLPLNL